MLTIKIDGKDYNVISGNRAFSGLMITAGGPDGLTAMLKKGALPFDLLVQCYWDSIRDKGKLTKEKLADYVDQEKSASSIIINEITAFATLAGEAKK